MQYLRVNFRSSSKVAMLFVLSLHLQALVQNVYLLLKSANLHSHRVYQLSLLPINCDISRDFIQSRDFSIFLHQLLVHSPV